jgi:quercetin dioxygenase-like cupin family protein
VSTAFSTALDDIEWEVVDARVKKKVLHGRRMTVTRYSFAGGGRFPHHSHDQEQITYVLTGELTFELQGERHLLKTGSLIMIPPHVPHSAGAGREGAEVLSIVSPARLEGRGIEMLGAC